MRIGFDAKRAFSNYSGLGNYSRSIINSLSKFYKKNEYYLYVPKRWNPDAIHISRNQVLRFPDSWLSSTLHPLWRSYRLAYFLNKDRIDIYHGLSNELPFRLDKYPCKTVVTIHDLIFLRFPQWYPAIDRKI